WADIKDRLQPNSGAALRAVAIRTDDDPWRQRLREAAARRDVKTLRDLAADSDVLNQPPTSLVLLGAALFELGERAAADTLSRQAQQKPPDDLWINFQRANFLMAQLSIAARVEAVGFFRAALAVRPTSSALYNSLGSALRDSPTLADSEAAFRQ